MEYLYIHRECGKPAFRWTAELPQYGEAVRADGVQHLDGSAMLRHEVMRCDSCGADLHGILLLENFIADGGS